VVGQQPAVDIGAQRPHQEGGIAAGPVDTAAGELRAPVAEQVDDRAEGEAGRAQPVGLAAPLGLGLRRHHPGLDEVAQPLRQQRARHQRHALVDVVELRPPGAQLAHDERRPSLGENLAGHGNRAELTISTRHGYELLRPAGPDSWPA